ncbi:endonuclease/exonuclease/phosphatase family protein [Bacteroidales bacterium AH-315-I05]|nr:endonuclease/exonuclease/phosphatase family protein [Bacteroidales bacterium AH-315-I05]
MKKLSLVSKIIFILNNIAAIGLLISYLAPFVSPALPLAGSIAFFGLAYPALLLLNALFLLYWLIRLKRQFLLSVIVILIGWNPLNHFIKINFDNEEISGNSTKVLSYNVRLFDLYNWTKNTQTRNKMFDFIKEENADVLCLQEFYYADSNSYFRTLDTLIIFQQAKNYHIEYTAKAEFHYFGIATFSKYPIVNKGLVSFKEKSNNICIFSDVKIGEDTVRIYNAHLASIHFRKSDYQFLEKMNESDTEKQIEGSKQILKRLKTAFIKRASQADAIAEHIKTSPHPVIMCGDFNDSPQSYAYEQISDGLKDAFIESGRGIGTTYIGRFPSFRIDYILHSEEIQSFGFRKIQATYSDHYPISCQINLKD